MFLGWSDIKIELLDECSSTVEELEVPFLVIKESLDNPILGFNVIKVLVDNTSNENALIDSLQSNVKSIKSNNIKALANLVNQSADHGKSLVHSMPSTTIVPAGNLISIQFKINLGNINNKIPIFFETKEFELPEVLETADTIVFVKSSMNQYLNIPVINNSKHIFFRKNTIIGRLNRFHILQFYKLKTGKQIFQRFNPVWTRM